MKSCYSLSRIDTILDTFGATIHFHNVDLRIGYYQIRIAENDVPTTSLSTRNSRYVYSIVTFSPYNAYAAFFSVLSYVAKGHTDSFIMMHLDDILVNRKPLDEHISSDAFVLDRLQNMSCMSSYRSAPWKSEKSIISIYESNKT